MLLAPYADKKLRHRWCCLYKVCARKLKVEEKKSLVTKVGMWSTDKELADLTSCSGAWKNRQHPSQNIWGIKALPSEEAWECVLGCGRQQLNPGDTSEVYKWRAWLALLSIMDSLRSSWSEAIPCSSTPSPTTPVSNTKEIITQSSLQNHVLK